MATATLDLVEAGGLPRLATEDMDLVVDAPVVVPVVYDAPPGGSWDLLEEPAIERTLAELAEVETRAERPRAAVPHYSDLETLPGVQAPAPPIPLTTKDILHDGASCGALGDRLGPIGGTREGATNGGAPARSAGGHQPTAAAPRGALPRARPRDRVTAPLGTRGPGSGGPRPAVEPPPPVAAAPRADAAVPGRRAGALGLVMAALAVVVVVAAQAYLGAGL